VVIVEAVTLVVVLVAVVTLEAVTVVVVGVPGQMYW
jgi:hypothetical protein